MKPKDANQRVMQFLTAYLTLDKTQLLYKTKVKVTELDLVLNHLTTEGVIKTCFVDIDESFRVRIYYLTKYEDLVEQLEKRKKQMEVTGV